MEIDSIYFKFHAILLEYIRGKVRSNEDAADILQEIFIKINANLVKLSDKEKLKSWIFSITRNAIIDYYRVNKSKQKIEVNENSLLFEDADDSTKGLDQCLTGMIELLPEDYRNIIIESEINGVRQKDLADKYGVTYSTLRSKVQRGRARLKRLLNECCKIEADKRGNIMSVQPHSNCTDRCNSCSE